MVAQVPDQVIPIFMAEGEDPLAAIMWMIAEPTALIGALLLAISTIRARVFPSWPAWLLIAAMALNIITNLLFRLPGAELGAVLFYLSLAGFGYVLLADQRVALQPATAAALN